MENDFKIMDEQGPLTTRKKKTGTGIIGLVIKSGLVKTEKQANALLILFIIIGMCGIVYLNLQTFSS
ncbi:MAG: hypothetical protein V4668_04500 [Patescibacteria group bacterium]